MASRGALRLDPALGANLRRSSARTAARARRAAPWLVAVGGLFALWVLALPHNPPCCFPDEPSTAYNAWAIAERGRDQYGARFPLYFQAFGEFRSPVQIYVMAGLFKVLGPHLLVGRYLTRAAMFATIALLGWLGYRITGRRSVAALVALLGLTTPQLYEISRLGTEGPLLLLPLAVFLLVLQRASTRERWTPLTGLALAVPLAVAAYTYPTARPLAPLLALGTLLFLTRRRLPGIVALGVALAALMAPILLFMRAHPGALSHYASNLSWYSSSMAVPDVVWTFVRHLAGNVGPGPVLLHGDPNPRHHVAAFGAVLVPMAVLAVGGLVLVALRRRRDPWWLYVVFGFVLALVPASLTKDAFHTPRLIAVPLFALVLCVLALQWVLEQPRRRAIVGAVVGVTAVQAAIFAVVYVRDGADPARVATFEGDFQPAWDAARKTGLRPIWVTDAREIDAQWWGVLDGVPRKDVTIWRVPNEPPSIVGAAKPDVTQFSPPPGVAVVSNQQPCPRCRVLARGPNFNAWVQR